MPVNALAVKRERGPFLWLLLAQLFFIFVTPFIADTGMGRFFLNLGIFAIIIAGIYAARARRGYFLVSGALLLPAMGAWSGPDILPGQTDDFARLLTAALCFSFAAVVVARSMAEQNEVNTETILAAVNVYLLIAFAFMMLYATLIVAAPGAFTNAGRSMSEVLSTTSDSYGFAALLYFSFITLTTLGYGDIVPLSPMARLLTSGQAVLGQLYVAIIIARIVSIEVSQRMRGR